MEPPPPARRRLAGARRVAYSAQSVGRAEGGRGGAWVGVAGWRGSPMSPAAFLFSNPPATKDAMTRWSIGPGFAGGEVGHAAG